MTWPSGKEIAPLSEVLGSTPIDGKSFILLHSKFGKYEYDEYDNQLSQGSNQLSFRNSINLQTCLFVARETKLWNYHSTLANFSKFLNHHSVLISKNFKSIYHTNILLIQKLPNLSQLIRKLAFRRIWDITFSPIELKFVLEFLLSKKVKTLLESLTLANTRIFLVAILWQIYCATSRHT